MKTGQVEQGQDVWPEAEMTSTGPSNAQHLLADGTSSSGTGQVSRGQAVAGPLFSPDPSSFSPLHVHSWQKPLIPQSCPETLLVPASHPGWPARCSLCIKWSVFLFSSDWTPGDSTTVRPSVEPAPTPRVWPTVATPNTAIKGMQSAQCLLVCI